MYAVIYLTQHYRTLHWNSLCTNICLKWKTYLLGGIIVVFSMSNPECYLILFFVYFFLFFNKEICTFSSYVYVSFFISTDCWAHY